MMAPGEAVKDLDGVTKDQAASRASRAPNDRPPRAGARSGTPKSATDLVSKKVIQVLVPVTLCAAYTCLLVRLASWRPSSSEWHLVDRIWRGLGLNFGQSEATSVTNSTSASGIGVGLTIVLMVCLAIVVASLLVLLIFYLGWHACLSYYFYLPSLITLGLITPAFAHQILASLNWFALDIFTALLVTWNFTVFGIIAVFGLAGLWAPLFCQQLYLIHKSAVLALLVVYLLPGWAPWPLLIFLMLWDLFAVLAPVGPLNLILELAERDGVHEMPGLLYTTEATNSATIGLSAESATSSGTMTSRNRLPAIEDTPAAGKDSRPESASKTQTSTISSNVPVDTIDSDSGQGPDPPTSLKLVQPAVEDATDKSDQPRPGRPTRAEPDWAPNASDSRAHDVVGRPKSESDDLIVIGLGDFIFYSLLIAATTKGADVSDYYTTLATYNAVMVGLVLTLAILALTGRSIPALPISISLGLSTAGLSWLFAAPFANRLAYESIFI